jgi:hypothetical protein
MFKWKGYRAAARGSPELRAYNCWRNLRRRCDNERNPVYRHYGGRGITYDEAWTSFETFLADMGLPRPGMCLERIDNDGRYCKDNCRWATRKEQSENKRSNRVIEFKGERKAVTRWAEQLGINVGTLRGRLDSGWTVERALSPGKFNCVGKFKPNSGKT